MGPERLFQTDWLVEEGDPWIIQPSVIDLPSFRLRHHLGTHHGIRRKKPQKAELGYPAETETRVLIQTRKPTRSDGVVDVPLGSERDPDVHVREKE